MSAAAPDRAVLAFQDDLDALVAEPAPLALRLWPLLGAAFLAGLLAVAAFARADIVVAATGRLVPETPPVVLAPVDRATLRALPVRAGELVRAGQVVAVLDSTFTAADRDALLSQRRSLAAQRDRLAAELAGTPLPPPVGDEAGLQSAVLAQRGAVHAARLAAHDAELAALRAALAAEMRAGAGVGEQVAIAAEVETMRGKLLESQVGSRLALLAARNGRLEAEKEEQRHTSRLAELRLRIDGRIAERDAYLQDWQRQVVEELARIGPELSRLDEQLAKARRLDALTELRAPRDAVVLEVARRAPGSLLREGEAVVVLVPVGVPLLAEVALRSADIGRLRAGDPARIKVDAFPWRRHGTLDGTLRAVSQESYPDHGAGTALHRAQIAIPLPALSHLPPGTALLAGMTVEADIKIGTRSVLDFFLDPLLRGLGESLGEP